MPFAIESYNRSNNAWLNGKFKNEVVQVTVPQKRGDDLIVLV